MKAVVVNEHGGVDKLLIEERPVPEPGPREVRVLVYAVGLNHMDLWVRRGVPGHQFPLPLILGSDAAGVVDAVGPGAHGVKEGDQVIVMPGVSCGVCPACQSGRDQLCPDYHILGESRDGCAADFVVVPDSNVVNKPQGLDYPQAAGFALVFQTAWSMLVSKAKLQAGEIVLIHGAGSGVGSAAVQIARMQGAQVIATAGSREKCNSAMALGADYAIDYNKQDFVQEVRQLCGRQGVDVVFEHVGQTIFTDSIRCLARGGRLVTCGATAGAEVTINLRQLFFKNLSIIGNTMGSRGELMHIVDLVGQGRLHPVVDRVMPLREVQHAHEILESRKAFGKIVLEP